VLFFFCGKFQKKKNSKKILGIKTSKKFLGRKKIIKRIKKKFQTNFLGFVPWKFLKNF
jgi:hypothetical protein